MADLAEPLRPARIVERPRRYQPLKGFSCGPGTEPWEGHVNRVVRRLSRGEAIPQTLVVVEDATGALVGVCSFWPRDLLLPLRSQALCAIPYINMIATERRFQGQILEDGSRPGDALLLGVLDHIRGMHGGVLPHVYALVAPANTPAHALFARHDFGEVSPLKAGGDAIRIRAPDQIHVRGRTGGLVARPRDPGPREKRTAGSIENRDATSGGGV
jgi:hypothetical protein